MTGRSTGRRLLDAVLTRTLRLPPGTHDYSLARDVRVPMRDGVELLADVYTPTDRSRGTILIRTPYGRATLIALMSAGFYAGHGYRVVNQSSRGTFGSGGSWQPFVTEVDDGADTVAWLRTQPWFDGRFALCGASYLGFTSWAIMADPPPELACAVIAISAHDNYRVTYGEGAFALEGSLSLLDGLPHVEDNLLQSLARFPTANRRLRRGYEELPLIRAQQTVLAGTGMPYAEWLRAGDPHDRLGHCPARPGPGAGRGAGAVARGLAGPVRRPDARPVRDPAAAGRRRRADHRSVDPCRGRHQGRPGHHAGDAGLAGRAPGRCGPTPDQPGPDLRDRRRLVV